MEKYFAFFLQGYVVKIIKTISEKYGYSYMEALKKFYNSKTYRMLRDIKLEMWDFGYPAILVMWECEQITGSPLSSSYLRTN